MQNFNDYQKLEKTHYQHQSRKKKIKTLNLLQINSKLTTAFEQEPITTYRQNKNLGNLIGSKKILDGKVVRKNNSKK